MNNCKVTKAQAILDQAEYGSLDSYQINMLVEMINKLSDQADNVDLLIDEIVRVRILSRQCKDEKDASAITYEIEEVCNRAISTVKRSIPLCNEIEHLKEYKRKTVTAERLLFVLERAPSSPIQARLAHKIEDWYEDNKAKILDMIG
mgnify:CR=1 FL=1